MDQDSVGILTPEAFEDVAELLTHADKLSKLAGMSREFSEIAEFDSFLVMLAASLDMRQADVTRVVEVLTNLQSLYRARAPHLDADTFGHALTSAFETQGSPDWKSLNLPVWEMTLPALKQLMDRNHPLNIFQKAVRLSYDRSEILQSARIVTDVRPVFDSDGSMVKRYVVTHTLIASTSKADESNRFHITVDDTDLRELSEEIARARRKAKAVKRSLSSQECPVTIVRESTNG